MITLSNDIEQIHYFGKKCMVKTQSGLVPLNEHISFLVKYTHLKKATTIDDMTVAFLKEFSVAGEYEDVKRLISNFVYSVNKTQQLFREQNENDIAVNNPIKVSGIEGRYVPYLLNIELTNKCNLNCTHCYKEANCHKINNIDLDDLSLLFSFLDSSNLSVTLTGGEPTLHPKFEKVVELCSEFGTVDLVTNGLNLKSVSSKVIRMINLIGISLYGTDDNTYKINTGIENGFSLLKESIEYLHSIKKDFIITIVLDKEKIQNLDLYIEAATQFGATSLQIGLPSKMGKLMTKNNKNEIWDLTEADKKYAYRRIREYQKKGTKTKILEWQREVYEKNFEFEDPNNPSNFYETHYMKCGAGTTQWSVSEKFKFRPCNLLCNDFAQELMFQSFKDYVEGLYIINWIDYMKDYETKYSQSGYQLSDCCKRMTDFLEE